MALMSLLSLIIIGIGLSIDSLVASITTGACMVKPRLDKALKIAFFMSFFQALMPLLGWLAGKTAREIIENYDHWIAFVLLLIVGMKMIYEGIKSKNGTEKCFCPSNTLLLAGMAIATSIDALIVGVGFGLISINIWQAILIIGITTFIFSLSGVFLGKRIGENFKSGIEIVGGIVMMVIGLKILLSHII